MVDAPADTDLSDLHAHRASHQPDEPCWTYLDRTWTWAQAWADVQRLAGVLQSVGIGRGDRIATLDKNNPAILTATPASCLLGRANAIVNWRLAGDELDYVINDSNAREKLAGDKIPRSIDVVETLPRNPSGKILKRELRKPYWTDGRQV